MLGRVGLRLSALIFCVAVNANELNDLGSLPRLAPESAQLQTVEVLSVDEAKAVRLARKYGIDVRLEGLTASLKLPVTRDSAIGVVDLGPDTRAFIERFQVAKRALASEKFELGIISLTQLEIEGYAPAADLLANMAERGEGMVADAERALIWRQRAASLGSSEAQYQLAEMHMYGRMVQQDEAMAITLYREAARVGHEGAKEKLRLIYAVAGLPLPDFSRP